MAVEVLYAMLAILIMAGCYALGHKFGMRRGKEITLAVQAEMRRREAEMFCAVDEYVPSLEEILGREHAVRQD